MTVPLASTNPTYSHMYVITSNSCTSLVLSVSSFLLRLLTNYPSWIHFLERLSRGEGWGSTGPVWRWLGLDRCFVQIHKIAAKNGWEKGCIGWNDRKAFNVHDRTSNYNNKNNYYYYILKKKKFFIIVEKESLEILDTYIEENEIRFPMRNKKRLKRLKKKLKLDKPNFLNLKKNLEEKD